jgi:hypothetical protein
MQHPSPFSLLSRKQGPWQTPNEVFADAEPAARRGEESGVTSWSKICFVVDFRNLLFGCDFDLSFSKGYSLMEIFNYEADFTAKCPT